MFIARQLSNKILEYLELFPILSITGPRQSGKSTLLTNLLPGYEYVTFDSVNTRIMLQDDPQGFISKYSNKVIFDEAQKAPELFELIKIKVDQNRTLKGQYILTGSNQFQLMHKITESLAGRIGSLTLLPFDYTELPAPTRSDALWQGSYPELIINNYKNRDAWCDAYITSYLEKDVREFGGVGDLREFRRLMQLLAGNCAQMVNQSALSRTIGVSVPTIRRWLSVLEASYIIFFLSPYTININRKLSKSPKLYFYDTGLVTYLVGIETARHYEQGPMSGALYENYVVAEIIKKALHTKERVQFSYLHTQDDAEVDLILERPQKLEWLEIKKTASFKPSMISTIKKFMRPEDSGSLIYEGKTEEYAYGIKLWNKHDYLMHT